MTEFDRIRPMLEDNKAVVRRFIDEVQTSDHLDTIDEIVAPDFVNRTRPATPDRAGLKAIHVPVFSAAPDLQVPYRPCSLRETS